MNRADKFFYYFWKGLSKVLQGLSKLFAIAADIFESWEIAATARTSRYIK